MGARIFADRADTAPINLDTTTFEITLEEPVYEPIDFDDEDYNWDEELYVEKIWLPVTVIEAEVTYQTEDVTTQVITDHVYNVTNYVDFAVTEDLERPDELILNFYSNVSSTHSAEAGDKLINWVEIENADMFGAEIMKVACISTFGDESDVEIRTYLGTGNINTAITSNDDIGLNTLAGELLPSTEDRFRRTGDWAYWQWNDDYSQTTEFGCEAVLDFYKQDNNAAFWSTYTVNMKLFVYSTSDATWTDVNMSEVATFDLVEPDYQEIFTSEAEQD